MIEGTRMSPEAFGWLNFIGGGAAYAAAGTLNGRLVKRFGISTMLRIGWTITLLAGFVLFAGYWFVGVNIWAIALPAFLFYFGSTLIWPNAEGH